VREVGRSTGSKWNEEKMPWLGRWKDW